AGWASLGDAPSDTNCSTMYATDGEGMYKCRQRERRVWEESCGSAQGAHIMMTVCAEGSSTVFSKAFDAPAVRRSALSKIITRNFAWVGRAIASWITPRTSSTLLVSPCGVQNFRSGGDWVSKTERHPSHCPHPSSPSGPLVSTLVHINAAAKASAALERPEPGGPVNSQEWLIARGSAPGRSRAARAACMMASRTAGRSANRCATEPRVKELSITSPIILSLRDMPCPPTRVFFDGLRPFRASA